MYSILFHFGAILIDLSNCYVYFYQSYMIMGTATSLVTLFPLLTGAWLLYNGWTQLRQVRFNIAGSISYKIYDIGEADRVCT